MQEGVHFFLAAQGIKKTRHRSDTLIQRHHLYVPLTSSSMKMIMDNRFESRV